MPSSLSPLLEWSDAMRSYLLNDCKLEPAQAQAVVNDWLDRAQVLASFSPDDRTTTVVPLAEETHFHEPRSAPFWLRAAATLIIRGSKPEDFHVSGQVSQADMPLFTTTIVDPLGTLLSERPALPLVLTRRGAVDFANLKEEYPRAWACLTCVANAFGRGVHATYRQPPAPQPSLPRPSEVVNVDLSRATMGGGTRASVISATDPRFDLQLFDGMRRLADDDLDVFIVGAMSRISRNSRKLFRVLEFVLAHHASILTTNLLLRDRDVWVRKGRLIRPDSTDQVAGIFVLRGTSGAHREIRASLGAEFGLTTTE